MTMDLFSTGVFFGFSIAAPVGPIGVLCIRRTLADGRIAGLVSGLGAATADAMYGIIAAFGLTFISSVLIDQQVMLKLVGGTFLCYLGVRTFFARPAERAAEVNSRGLLGAYSSTLFLTLTNPVTILSFVAMFAGLGIANTRGDYLAAMALVAGVFTGSAMWWLILSAGVSFWRARFDARAMTWVNRFSGMIIASFGLLALGSLLI